MKSWNKKTKQNSMVFLRAASQHAPLLGLNVFQVWHLNLFSLKLFMFLSAVPVVTPGRDSFTVPLHNPNGRIVTGIWKLVKIPTSHVSVTCIATPGNPYLYLYQPIIQGWCQPIAGQVSMMMLSIENFFHITGPLCGKFTSQRWIPLTKASDVELWCFIWSVPEQELE